ncbi:MAG: hypothetical protein A2919_00145 [Candidatus Spechtbacteria bacterium RIFCSPLOWO2_01_FULL_43_12]|uniref:Uncharacterized protein n=1 Tax=Candidatus Spechtbacteria bacterium RIFCSPLOWO2_01_FULL_43_12 TaxID=1802162 RepID=A0A1G2HEN0_9BACT|nr:MAG: hypothetical protein A2919_00145 [Candidatus Spechtbacteria bacterium RIFCSPLOWO2_01_FULL_43_12]
MPRKINPPEETLPPKKPFLARAHMILSLIFYIIWIPIGLVFLLSVYANFRQGAYKSLFNPAIPSSQTGPTDAPAEADLPGVGLVNVSCVQSALNSEAIQKIIAAGNTSTLSDEEKSRLETCIVTPAASPTPTS